MDKFEFAGTDDRPTVILDKDSSKFEFSGKSLPEDVEEFYRPIIDWLDDYCEDPNDKTDVVFKMDYFNTASSKMLLDVMGKFEEMKENGKDVVIHWYYMEDDEDMQEAGEGYEELVEVPFEYGTF